MKFTQAFAAIVAVASAVNIQKIEIDDAEPALAQFAERVLADMEPSEVLAQTDGPRPAYDRVPQTFDFDSWFANWKRNQFKWGFAETDGPRPAYDRVPQTFDFDSWFANWKRNQFKWGFAETDAETDAEFDTNWYLNNNSHKVTELEWERIVEFMKKK
jgi:hypothetical protein